MQEILTLPVPKNDLNHFLEENPNMRVIEFDPQNNTVTFAPYPISSAPLE